MSSPLRRYELVSRRALLRRSAAATAVAAVGAACGNGDQQVLADASAVPGSSNSATVAPPTSTTGVATVGFRDGAELVVSFTYERLPGGKNLPPYMAVWVEDADGVLLETIELWFEQTGKGPRWLPDLRRWFSVDQERIASGGVARVDAISSATRLPGTTSVAWNGVVHTGAAASGPLFICIESARERGPYSLIREPITIDGAPFTLDLPADQELVMASVAYVI